MLTEYHTEKELIAEFNAVYDKVTIMKQGWFGKKLLRYFKKYKQGGCICQNLTYNKQHYMIDVSWCERSYKHGYFTYNITTQIETKNGKLMFSFGDKDGLIMVCSPHCQKRYKERCEQRYKERCEQVKWLSSMLQSVPYTRNGRTYELLDLETDIIIARRGKEDSRFLYCITALSRDMCTNKNYQELLSRVGKQIDNDDVYDWK